MTVKIVTHFSGCREEFDGTNGQMTDLNYFPKASYEVGCGLTVPTTSLTQNRHIILRSPRSNVIGRRSGYNGGSWQTNMLLLFSTSYALCCRHAVAVPVHAKEKIVRVIDCSDKWSRLAVQLIMVFPGLLRNIDVLMNEEIAIKRNGQSAQTQRFFEARKVSKIADGVMAEVEPQHFPKVLVMYRQTMDQCVERIRNSDELDDQWKWKGKRTRPS